MTNRLRGEVALKANGRTYTLCLTLGALAELESAYGGEDILSLAERFSSGVLTSNEAMTLLAAALKGGGEAVDHHDLAEMKFEHGMAGLIRTLADLLSVTFGGQADPAASSAPQIKEAQEAPRPFPGGRS
ncbi:MAG: gene transfer agent family protein [Parvibaculum sp.]